MNLLSALGEFLLPTAPPEAEVLAAIERLIDLVDPALRRVGGYVRKLEAPVHHALGYCQGLVGGVPGPVDINHRAFAGDPLVHTLFATAADIDLMLGDSPAVRDYLADPASLGANEVYALLSTRRCSKRVLGYALNGEGVRADVPQELLYFTAHALFEPEANLEAIREGLRKAAFDSLGRSFHAHIDALRQERTGLQGDRHLEQAHLTFLRGKTDETEYAVHTRRIAELDTSLRQAVESLMPEQLLGALVSNLTRPEQLLRLNPLALAVDRAGVVSSPELGVATDAFRLELCELISRDQRRNIILLVRIQREEAVASIEAANARRHRFLII